MAAAAISADFRFTRVAAVAECGTGGPANVLHGWGGGGPESTEKHGEFREIHKAQTKERKTGNIL